MVNGTQQHIQTIPQMDPLKPPTSLSEEERWIVRLHGKDMGPFSSKGLYPMLLRGEVEPETLLLDQNRFSRCRLREVPEFQPYLDLHNTQNPILLKEQEMQKREDYWKETGRKRLMFGIFSGVAMLALAVIGWRVFIYKSSDVFLMDGDFEFAVNQSFKGLTKEKQMRSNWKWNRPRSSGSRSSKNTKAGAENTTAASIDFNDDKGGGGIPNEKIRAVIQSNIRSVFGCFKQRMEQDSRFTGGQIKFVIQGNTGGIGSLDIEETDYSSTSLVSCVRRSTRGWSFPTFPGTAIVYFPVHVRKRARW